MSLLEIEAVNTGYGKKQVLFDVNLSVNEGETVLLVGANGSGKSTLLKTIYGRLRLWPDERKSRILFEGKEIRNARSHELIKQGLMYIPQKNELFEDMTVQQNLDVALLHLDNRNISEERIEEVFERIDVLARNRNQLASNLSGGERKLLSLGMLLAVRPKAVLYDEPLAGLSSNNLRVVLNWLEFILDKGTTLLIVEHRIKELMSIADRIVGLKLGRRNTEALDNIDRIKSFMI